MEFDIETSITDISAIADGAERLLGDFRALKDKYSGVDFTTVTASEDQDVRGEAASLRLHEAVAAIYDMLP